MNYHTILIGGGINSLVCAALLAKAGKKTLVVERTDQLGGCIRSKKIEGCVIDTLSTAYPLFITSPAYFALKDDLTKEGVEFISNTTPTGSVLSNKKFTIIKTNREENIKTFNALCPGDGDAFNQEMNWVIEHAGILFTFLGNELVNFETANFLGKYIWKKGITNVLEDVASFLPSVRNNLPNYFKSPELIAAMAPWVLHTGLTTESLFSSTMSKIVAMTVEMVGLPLVKGGSYRLVDAFKSIIEKNNGSILLNTHVDEIIVNHNKAIGIKTANGDVFYSRHVAASATPQQLYKTLLKCDIPKTVRQDATRYKFGKGNMQIHIILNEKPKWFNIELANVVYVHLTDGIDDISKACNEALRQHLPDKGTICIAQPVAVDPSRASDGKYVLWIQLPECPNYPVADAGDSLNDLTKGEWTAELEMEYANRIIRRISHYISNIETACIYKDIISPRRLADLNINLMHGDPYSGSCELDQYLLWRPLKSTKNHETPIVNLFHIGASSHPGPGLSGVSGFHVAKRLMKK